MTTKPRTPRATKPVAAAPVSPPADEPKPGAPDALMPASVNTDAKPPAAKRTRRGRNSEAVTASDVVVDPLAGKVTVEDAAAVLRCYVSEVAGVEKTGQGYVATTTDGQHYLLGSAGAVWLEHPEQGLVQAAS